MIYCYINSTQRCAGSIVIDIIPTNGADKRKFFPFAPYFPVTNVIKRYFYPYFPAIIGIKGILSLISLFIGDNEDKNGTLFPIFPS